MAKIGIYNMYWSTLGGGEKHLGEFAAALSDRHEVTLITPDQNFDVTTLQKRLEINISRLNVMLMMSDEEDYIEQLTSQFDLFVNGTYMSKWVRSRSSKSMYFVFFPQNLHPVSFTKSPMYYLLGDVSHYRGDIGQELYGESTLVITNWRRKGGKLRLYLSRNSNVSLKARIGDAEVPLTRRGQVIELNVSHGEELLEITLFPEFTVTGGVCYLNAVQYYNGWRWRNMSAQDIDQIHSPYTDIVANSAYTKHHIEKRWGRTKNVHVIEPQVDQFENGHKINQIVSVGRFFVGDHCKKQDVLVQAFIEFHKLNPNFKLKLVGGLKNNEADLAYVKKMQKMAQGYPIEFLLNATREQIKQAYAESAVYWHATGFDEDLEKFPDRAEHFGIAPVEAMSAGCVPFVFNAGGAGHYIDQKCGKTWSTIEELVSLTQEAVQDRVVLTEMSVLSVEVAARFERAAFRIKVNRIVDEILGDLR